MPLVESLPVSVRSGFKERVNVRVSSRSVAEMNHHDHSPSLQQADSKYPRKLFEHKNNKPAQPFGVTEGSRDEKAAKGWEGGIGGGERSVTWRQEGLVELSLGDGVECSIVEISDPQKSLHRYSPGRNSNSPNCLTQISIFRLLPSTHYSPGQHHPVTR